MINAVSVLTALNETKVRYSTCRKMAERVLVENEFDPTPERISYISMNACGDLRQCCEFRDLVEDMEDADIQKS
jgi:hypothetical protein